ncbi:unnamed protein product [Rhizophagus irregularis]|nr:unnamed protein product [Rhizophagus irregularis]
MFVRIFNRKYEKWERRKINLKWLCSSIVNLTWRNTEKHGNNYFYIHPLLHPHFEIINLKWLCSSTKLKIINHTIHLLLIFALTFALANAAPQGDYKRDVDIGDGRGFINVKQ